MSKPLVLTLPHALGRAEARRRIDAGVDQLIGQLGPAADLKRSWTDDILTFSVVAVGQTVSGLIEVADQEVRLEVNLPGIFALIAGKVKGRLRDQAQILLDGPPRGKG